MLRVPAGITHAVLDTPGGLRGFELARARDRGRRDPDAGVPLGVRPRFRRRLPRRIDDAAEGGRWPLPPGGGGHAGGRPHQGRRRPAGLGGRAGRADGGHLARDPALREVPGARPHAVRPAGQPGRGRHGAMAGHPRLAGSHRHPGGPAPAREPQRLAPTLAAAVRKTARAPLEPVVATAHASVLDAWRNAGGKKAEPVPEIVATQAAEPALPPSCGAPRSEARSPLPAAQTPSCCARGAGRPRGRRWRRCRANPARE